MPKILNIAHRGGAGLQPENTLAAFRDAVAREADGAELDVQLSKDGQVVVYHDYRLKPEITRLNGHWLSRPTPRIKDLKRVELESFDVGRCDPHSRYAASHPDVCAADGERIPTLAEVVAVAKTARKDFWLQVELKTSFSNREEGPDPAALAGAAVKVLRDTGYLHRTIFVGFDWPALLHAKKLAPQTECWFTTLSQSWFEDGPVPPEDDPPSDAVLQTLRHWWKTGTSPWAGGFDAVKHDGSILKAIKAAGGDGWFPPYRDINPMRVSFARALGLKVGAWTVDEPKEMKRMIANGLDAICTDRPDRLAALL